MQPHPREPCVGGEPVDVIEDVARPPGGAIRPREHQVVVLVGGSPLGPLRGLASSLAKEIGDDALRESDPGRGPQRRGLAPHEPVPDLGRRATNAELDGAANTCQLTELPDR